MATLRIDLDNQVEIAKAAGLEFLETEPEVINSIIPGDKFGPNTETYIIYKNIKLCVAGMAEKIAKAEGLDVHAILFAEEARKLTVSSVAKK